MGAKYEETMSIRFAAADVWRRAIEVLNHVPGSAGVQSQPVVTASLNADWKSWGKNKENVRRIRAGLEPPVREVAG